MHAVTHAVRWLGGSHAKRVFLLPAVLVVAALSIFPFLYAVLMSFTNLNLSTAGTLPFSGGTNWRQLWGDETFRGALRNTVLFVVIGTLLQYVLALRLALTLSRMSPRTQGVFRTIYLLPMMLTPVAIGFVIGRTMFAEANGPINHLLSAVRLPRVGWESDAWAAWWKIILVDSWEWTPLMFIVLLAALKALPHEPFEAARIDGASDTRIFWRLTMPMLWPTSVTIILIRGIELFKLLDIVQITTGGGPGNATNTASLYTYNTVFRGFQVGYASAVGISLFVTMLAFAALLVTVARRGAQ